MSPGLILFLITLVVATTIYKIIALKHGSGRVSDAYMHELEKELADRDDRANALEERIRVLEKIVTDDHKSHSLSEEIDKLKENTGGQ